MSATFELRVAQELLRSAEADRERAALKETSWANKRRALNVEIGRLQAEVRRLDLPSEPTGERTIVRFEKRFEGNPKRYHYAAIRGGGLWYVTGAVTAGLTWERLVAFVRRYNVLTDELPRDTEDLLPPF